MSAVESPNIDSQVGAITEQARREALQLHARKDGEAGRVTKFLSLRVHAFQNWATNGKDPGTDPLKGDFIPYALGYAAGVKELLARDETDDNRGDASMRASDLINFPYSLVGYVHGAQLPTSLAQQVNQAVELQRLYGSLSRLDRHYLERGYGLGLAVAQKLSKP